MGQGNGFMEYARDCPIQKSVAESVCESGYALRNHNMHGIHAEIEQIHTVSGAKIASGFFTQYFIACDKKHGIVPGEGSKNH